MARKRKSSRKTRTLLTAAMAFAASPQGRKLLQQAKEYAARPETKAKAAQLFGQAKVKANQAAAQAKARRSGTSYSGTTAPAYGTAPHSTPTSYSAPSASTSHGSAAGPTSTNPL